MKASFIVAGVRRTNDPSRLAVELAPVPEAELGQHPSEATLYLVPGQHIVVCDAASVPPVNAIVEATYRVTATPEAVS